MLNFSNWSNNFIKLHPGVSFIGPQKWKLVRTCLTENLATVKISSVDDLALLRLLESAELSEAKKDFVALFLLPYLIPPKRTGKRKKNADESQRPHRLSLEERRESFILHVQSANDALPRLNELKKRLLTSKQTFQPLIVAVGPVTNIESLYTANDVLPRLNELKKRLLTSKRTFRPLIVAVGPVTNIESLYVAVNDQLYPANNITSAIKLALSVFFSLHCKYPENTVTLWTLLQRLFIGIELPTDVLNVQANISILYKNKDVHDPDVPLLLESACDATDKSLDVSSNESDDDESINYEKNKIEQPYDTSLIDDSPYEYTNVINNAWLIFTANLYTKRTIPRKHVDFITQQTNTLLSTVLGTVKQNICLLIKSMNNEQVDDVNVFFNNIFTCSRNFDTEQKRFTQYENLNTFIRPESYNIGERKEYKRKNNVVQLVHVPVNAQFIRLGKVLKLFFELPDMYNETMSYIKSLESNKHIISNIIQADYWRERSKSFGDKIVFPMVMYYDDYENNNPLGTQKGVAKSGAVYIQIPVIPVQYQSKIENIFLFILFNTIDRQVLKNDIIFTKAVVELNCLNDAGIEIDLPSGPKKIFFELILFVGDNLGVHSIAGLTEKLNSRLQGFDYGANYNINKPPQLKENSLKKFSIVMSSSEMLCLVENLNLIIGQLVPLNNKHWELFLTLTEIVTIVSSSSVRNLTHALLETTIYEYLDQLKELFPNQFKPKHHFLVHYPRCMLRFGPLWKISCMRFESKNQEAKQISKSTSSRVNINRTIAIMHQLLLNCRFLIHKQLNEIFVPQSLKKK
ncbi:hypothetical protein TSAR_013512 [Trichomalopsis sarcophagae]|uniref:Uncharacterized protein n=1 Tax=Trichomalopsis sarcophagae TaxID=543379 RepID=A0A232EFV8_9HYME|nr:hypothetical protein TSAR_013512 [Trichomalopsis sarcophagae]